MHAFDLPPAPLLEDDSGVIRIVGSRVTLESVVAAFDRGATPEEIAQSFPSVALNAIYAVLTYVVSRRTEVDVYLAQREHAEAQTRDDIERRSPSAGLRARLLARRDVGTT